MKKVMPPVLCYELGDQDRNMVRLLRLPLHRFNEADKRPDDAAITGTQDDQANPWIPLLPFLLQPFDFFFIETDVDGDDVV